jgi:hypothetical protein
VNGWLLLAFLAVPFVFLAVSRNQARRSIERVENAELHVDEFGARRLLATGREEAVEWGELAEVEVLTANTGPYRSAGGVVILAATEERGCLVPIDKVADCGLLEQLQRLPGFDPNVFTSALVAPPTTRTTCWQKQSPSG